MEGITSKEAMALLVAGKMTAAAYELDADALEKYPDKLEEGDGFVYADICRAAIVFHKTVFKRVHEKRNDV